MAQNKSIAANQFPLIVWRDGQKQLWNPIHRKALKNLPEERVRLRVLEYLLHGGWSKHRISTEEAIDLPQKQANLRTDLICYTQEFNPLLLVECKAETITLSDKTAEQIARYNQGVSAPYLLMTNGRLDRWYALNDQSAVQTLHTIPDALPERKLPEANFSYWQSRGFAGKNANPELRLWLANMLTRSFRNDDVGQIRHLSFKTNPGDLDLKNYYKIYTHSDHRVALSCTATEFGSSRLIGILNRDGKNEAVAEINLDLLFEGRAPNASVYWAGDTKNIDVGSAINDQSDAKPSFKNLVTPISALLINSLN